MSQPTRLFVRALRSVVGQMIVDGLTHKEIAQELRNLRSYGRCYARNELFLAWHRINSGE